MGAWAGHLPVLWPAVVGHAALCSRGPPVLAGSSQGSCPALSFQQALDAYSTEASLFLLLSLTLALDCYDCYSAPGS